MKIVEKLKKVAEDAKKPAGKDNNKKGGPRKVTTPKGKTKMAIKDKGEKGEKKDLSKTLTTKNSKRTLKSVEPKSLKKREEAKKEEKPKKEVKKKEEPKKKMKMKKRMRI